MVSAEASNTNFIVFGLIRSGPKNWLNSATYYWSTYTKSGKSVVIYRCKGYQFPLSFCEFSDWILEMFWVWYLFCYWFYLNLYQHLQKTIIVCHVN